MEIVDVIKKLVGDIEPIGETHTDSKRLDNLKVMTALVDELLENIYTVAKDKDCHEYSRKQSGSFAHRFLEHITKEYSPKSEIGF